MDLPSLSKRKERKLREERPDQSKTETLGGNKPVKPSSPMPSIFRFWFCPLGLNGVECWWPSSSDTGSSCSSPFGPALLHACTSSCTVASQALPHSAWLSRASVKTAWGHNESVPHAYKASTVWAAMLVAAASSGWTLAPFHCCLREHLWVSA